MPTVHAHTVRRAAEIVGGIQVLAGRLGVRGEFIKNWIEGELTVPQEVFLRCVDIVNAHQISDISGGHANRKGPVQ
jgi:DNA-binding transcriptional regulator YdaS (Cro superfamily)